MDALARTSPFGKLSVNDRCLRKRDMAHPTGVDMNLTLRIATVDVAFGRRADILHLIFARGLDKVWRPERQHGQAQVFWQLKMDNRVDFAGSQTRGKQ
jgi:hypothetical protein